MSSIEQVIYEKLNDEADGIDDHVGSSTSARIFPGNVPQGQALPAIRYNRISTTYNTHLNGVTGLAETTFQIDAYAATYDTAIALGECIRASLQDYRDLDADPQVDGTLEEGHYTTYDEPIDASDVGRWLVSQDFRVFFVPP